MIPQTKTSLFRKRIRRLVITILVLFILLWSLWHGVRLYILMQPKTSFPLGLEWQVDLGRSTYERPAYQDGLVLLPASGLVLNHWYGVDAVTGQEVWSQQIGRTNFLRCLTPEYIVLSSPWSLIVLQTSTGDIIWQENRPPADSATCSKEVVFSSGVPRDSILAYDLATGKRLWAGTEPWKPFNGLIYNPEMGMIIASESILPEKLYIVEAQSGLLKHSFEEVAIPPNDGRWERGPMYQIDRGELFIGGTVQDAQTGQVIHKEERFRSVTPPTITEDTMYLSAIFDGVVAFDRDTYNLKWRYQPQPKFPSIPLYTISPVAVLEGIGYVIFSDATLRAFDIKNGQELGYWQPGWLDLWRWPVCTIPPLPKCFLGFSTARAGLIASSDTLFVSFGDGKLYAFKQ